MRNLAAVFATAVLLGSYSLAGATGPTRASWPLQAQARTCMGDAGQPAGATRPPSAIAARLTQMAWLSGIWVGANGTSVLEERWTPATGGAMLATSRTVRGSVMTEFEFLCIVERAGTLVYQAMPNARMPATDFYLTAIDASSAAFENPAHDFPKKIRYALRPDGGLDATISGEATQRAITFSFKKQ